VLGAARSKNNSEKSSPVGSPASQFTKSKSDGSIKKLKAKKMKFGSLNQIVKTATHTNTNGKRLLRPQKVLALITNDAR
jgi:hypothetical protein